MAHKIAVWDSKGGVGKSTTVVQVAPELAQRGYTVLVIDFDHNNPGVREQMMTDDEVASLLDDSRSTVRLVSHPERGHEGLLLNVNLNLDAVEHIGGQVVRRYPQTIHQMAQAHGYRPGTGHLHVIPGNRQLMDALIELMQQPGDTSKRRLRLRQALYAADAQYDFILIDCPPTRPIYDLGLDLALCAADSILMPVPFSKLAYNATLDDLKDLPRINQVRGALDLPPLQVLGVLLTRYKPNTKSHAALLDRFQRSQEIGPHLIPAVLPFEAWIDDAILASAPPQFFAPESSLAQQLPAVVGEVIARAHKSRAA